jgi:hypothetical protein
MDTYTPERCEPRVIALPDALGSQGLDYDLPGVCEFAVVSFAFELDASAAVANRQVIVTLRDSRGAILFGVAAPAVQTANTSVVYSFAPEVPLFGTLAAGIMGGPFPGGRLPQNLTVGVVVGAAGAGDLIAAARLLVHQYDQDG